MTGYTTFRQINVRYTDVGKGRVIVLLHGFLESLDVWDEFAQKLSSRFRVICIDLPGHGETPSIGYVHSMELMAKCVKAVMDGLHLRKYVMVGHSLGGYVGLAFAGLFPRQLKGLCLFHSTALPDTPERKKDRTRAIVVVKKNHKQYISDHVVRLFAPSSVKQMSMEIKKLKKIAAGISQQAIVATLEGMKERPDRTALLSTCPFPVLFIAGKKDVIIPWESINPQVALALRGQLFMLEDAGHIAFYEEPARTAGELKRFAGKCFRSIIP